MPTVRSDEIKIETKILCFGVLFAIVGFRFLAVALNVGLHGSPPDTVERQVAANGLRLSVDTGANRGIHGTFTIG